MKRTTLKDIARELKTTIATVSRALHDSPEISNDMKEKVRHLANIRNYKPNHTALSLKFQRSFTFGVIFPTLSQYYMNKILHGLSDEATKNGYKLIIAESNYKPKNELKLIQEFYELNVDALMILPSRKLNLKKNELETIIKPDIPFLVIDRILYLDKINVPFISSDDYVGAKEGIIHLIEQGYTKIAHVKGLDSSSVSNIRYKAYMDTMQLSNLQIDNKWVVTCKKFTLEEGEEMASYFMSLENKPDAIFCISDILAIGIISGLRKLGYKVPSQVGVLGFSNSDMAQVCYPSLSSIHQPGEEIGKKSIRLILSALTQANDISNKHIIMKTSLVSRESTNRLNSI